MKLFYLLIGLIPGLSAKAQIDWTKSHDWMVYKVPTSVIFKVSPDSLSYLPRYALNFDSVIRYVETSKPLPKDTKAEWMGGFLASCIIDGETKKILISSYGGFLYDPVSGLFYQLPADRKDTWLNYVNGCVSKI